MAEPIHFRQGTRDLPEILYHLGVSKAIICPGSRNAPLILSFAKYSSIDCISLTDERSAAYFALGMTQYSKKPVALVCTSGTALLNFAPAVAEAYYQKLPLIVISADRPKELIDQADGQTIKQKNIFVNFIKASYSLPVETNTEDDLWYSNRMVSSAMNMALCNPCGPVHINVPLREPLYVQLPKAFSSRWMHVKVQTDTNISDIDKKYFLEKWTKYSRKLIMIGVYKKNETLQKELSELLQNSDCVIIAENLSNINQSSVIYNPEAFIASLSEDEKLAFRPDLLVTLGDSIVSKRLKQYLRSYSPSEHWHINFSDTLPDTYKSITHSVSSDPGTFLKILSGIKNSKSAYFSFSNTKQRLLEDKHNRYLQQSQYSDLKIVDEILEVLPEGYTVHFSNSTPVRYSQLFNNKPNVEYFCNRGTSGIDGCVSTAAGSAYISEKPTLLVTGDLSFIYDSNGLWNNGLPNNLKIIVLNNKVGNIFRMIDASEEINEIQHFFETPQQVGIRKIAEAFGVEYLYSSNLESLQITLAHLFSSPKPIILECETDATVNTKVFKGYYKFLQQQ